jgi:hypothetical protein
MPMPRPSDQPFVQEDAAENAARERKTIRELVEEAKAAGEDPHAEVTYEPLDLDEVIARIGPERWEELRARRDRILARLRQREEG